MPDHFVQAHRELRQRYERKFNNVEAAVRYLEDDEWVLWSGYKKEALAKVLCRTHLRFQHQERLRKVILRKLEQGYFREFGQYKKLAYALDCPALRDELKTRMNHGDKHIQRRIRWMVEYFILRDAQQKRSYKWQE